MASFYGKPCTWIILVVRGVSYSTYLLSDVRQVNLRSWQFWIMVKLLELPYLCQVYWSPVTRYIDKLCQFEVNFNTTICTVVVNLLWVSVARALARYVNSKGAKRPIPFQDSKIFTFKLAMWTYMRSCKYQTSTAKAIPSCTRLPQFIGLPLAYFSSRCRTSLHTTVRTEYLVLYRYSK